MTNPSAFPITFASLRNEVAFITGASAGIGAACAHHLAALGAAVVLGARRTDKLEAVRASILATTPSARVFVGALDVTDAAQLDRWLAAGTAAFGEPTIVIDNAGLALGRDHVVDLNDVDVDTVLNVNVRAAMRLVQRVLPGMKARNRGDIVMMNSIAGSEPYAGGSVYCATKAAMQAFTRSLRAELLGTNIRVVGLDPGLVETEFSVVRHRGDVDAAGRAYQGLEPLTPNDIADCVAFALTRPRRMSLDKLVILAQAQLGTQAFHRT